MNKLPINHPAYHPDPARENELIQVLYLVGDNLDVALAFVNEPGASFDNPRTTIERFPADEIVYASFVADARTANAHFSQQALAAAAARDAALREADAGDAPGAPVPRRLA